MTKKKSHTPFNQLVDGIREVAKTEAAMGGPPRETVSEESPPWPFKDGRVVEQDLKGNLAPGVDSMTDTSKKGVMGKEGGTIAGKDGDRLNPTGDQDDDENGSVHPKQRVKGSAPWSNVVRNNLEKRKRAERRDSGEGTNEAIDDDERQQIVEEIQELIADKEPSVIAEDIVVLAETIQTLEAEVEQLTEEYNSIYGENLRNQLLIHIRDLAGGMTLMQAERFLKMAVDREDMERMSTDAEYCARILGRLKEEVVREGRRPARPHQGITEAFSDEGLTQGFSLQGPLRAERVAPLSDAGMQSVVDGMKIFRK